MSGIAFVEECTTQQFDISELSGRQFCADKWLHGIEDSHLHLAGYIDIQP